MTLDEKKNRIEEALHSYDSPNNRDIGGGEFATLLDCTRDLLRLLEEMPGEIPEKEAGIGMVSLGRVRGHNALRQRVIDILMGDS